MNVNGVPLPAKLEGVTVYVVSVDATVGEPDTTPVVGERESPEGKAGDIVNPVGEF
jgi:hypothetical protein